MSELRLPPDGERPGPLMRLVRDQRVAFLIVGGINTVFGFGVFIAADITVGRLIDESAGTIAGSLVVLAISHVLGVLFAFVMHRRFVFKVTGTVGRDLARFESVYLVALAINAVTLPILVQLGLERIIAQGLILLATTTISYVGHRYFSFQRPAIAPDPTPHQSDSPGQPGR